MMIKKVCEYPLEVFTTAEGSMFPIYRDWDKFHSGYVPKMVYATTMMPNTTKGPILHRKRAEFITAISGCVEMEYYEGGDIKSTFLRDDTGTSKIVMMPAGVPKRLYNRSSHDTAVIVNLPSRAWHPDDQDTEKFRDWNECLSVV